MADSREIAFQNDIINYLKEHKWLVGEAKYYNKELALYPDDVISFFSGAFPTEWERFKKHYPQDSETAFLKSVARQLGKEGTLSVLRHGFKDRGARVRLAQFKPDHNLNEDILRRYELNRLRVIPMPSPFFRKINSLLD